jgi:hypothetical protein
MNNRFQLTKSETGSTLHISNADETIGECVVDTITQHASSSDVHESTHAIYRIDKNRYRAISLSIEQKDATEVLHATTLTVSGWIHALDCFEERVRRHLFTDEKNPTLTDGD